MDECKNRDTRPLEWKDGDGEREGFEKWATDKMFGLSRYASDPGKGRYMETNTELAWSSWQARQPEIDALKAEIGLCNGTLESRERNIESILEESSRLKAENERLRKDAKRLDFIESSRLEINDTEEGFVINRITGYPNDREWYQLGEGETIREAIDAAMTAPDTKGE